MVATGSVTELVTFPTPDSPTPHHQAGSCHMWPGTQGPGRFCSLHWGSSTSRSCHQLCPPEGRGLEGATPSTGQREGQAVSRGWRVPPPPT